MSIQPEIDGMAVLQEWEGYVLEVTGAEFVARLVDVTAGSSHEDDEEAITPIAKLSDGDAAALREGGILRWVIGYECSPSGARKCVSRISFRSRPRMTERDYQQCRKWARETMQAFRP